MTNADAQRALIALGYNLGRGGPSGNGDDGIWGWLSQTACAAFQRARGLAATGRLDAVTIKALQAAVAENRPTPPGLFSSRPPEHRAFAISDAPSRVVYPPKITSP